MARGNLYLNFEKKFFTEVCAIGKFSLKKKLNWKLFSYLSQCGKSTMIRHLLVEDHWGPKGFDQLVYIYKEEDNNVKELMKHFGKNGIFLKEIPNDLDEILVPGR